VAATGTARFLRAAAHHLERGGVTALVQAAIADGEDSEIARAAEAEAAARGRVVIRRRDRPARPLGGARQRTLIGHAAPVAALVAAGDLLVSGSADGTLRVWDLDDGSFLRVVAPGGATFAATTRAAAPAAPAEVAGAMPVLGVQAVCAVDGAVVATHGDGVVRAWDPDTGACLAEARIRSFGWSICRVGSAVGARVAIAGDDAVLRLLDARTLEVVAAAEALPAASSGEGAPYLARVAAVGDWLVVGGASRGLTVVDAATLAPVGELRGHDAAPRGLAAAGGARLLSTSRDGTVALWDVAARRLLARVDVPGGAWSVAAGSAALVGTRAGTLCRLRLPDLALERTAPVHAGAVGAVVALADRRAFTGGDDRAVRLVDLEVAGVARPSHAGPITALAVIPAAIVTGGADGAVKIWDPQRGRSLRTIPGDGRVAALAATAGPDGVVVLARSGDRVVEHRLGATGTVASRPLAATPAPEPTLEAAAREAASPSGDRTAAATRDDCVVVSTADGAELARWTCDAAPQALAFLDDRTLVVGDAAGELAILDVP
jgi:WD40 repeat protein